MEFRNRQRLNAIITEELHGVIADCQRQLDALAAMLTRQPSPAIDGHIRWCEEIVRVCNWLKTRYPVTSPTVVREIQSDVDTDSTKSSESTV